METWPQLSPLDALARVASRLRPGPPVTKALSEEPRGYLAETVEVEVPSLRSASSGRHRLALANGFAVPSGLSEGSECTVLGTIASGGVLDETGSLRPFGPSRACESQAEPEGLPGIWRVEVGAPLPHDAQAIVPPEDVVLVGSRRLRILRRPEPGVGIWPRGAGDSGAKLSFPQSTYLSARLRSLFVSAGLAAVPVYPQPLVGFATIGDELTDLSAPFEEGRVPDVVALAIEDCIRRLGLAPLPFGILPDAPEALERTAIRARERGVEVLVVSGGLGSGFGDRTLEALERVEARIPFAARISQEGWEFLIARLEDCHILAISGRPLAASAELDLLVRPGLLRMLGAPQDSWNWAKLPRISALLPLPLENRETGTWGVFPARLVRAADGKPACAPWAAPHPWAPTLPGQDGWAVLAPTGTLAHFVPTARGPSLVSG